MLQAAVYGNAAYGHGGGIYCVSCRAVALVASSISWGRSSYGWGGGVHLSACAVAGVLGTTVSSNLAPTAAGVYAGYPAAASTDAGAVDSSMTAAVGAAAAVNGSSLDTAAVYTAVRSADAATLVILYGSVFHNNTASAALAAAAAAAGGAGSSDTGGSSSSSSSGVSSQSGASSSTDIGSSSSYENHGGALFLSGRVAAAVLQSDLAAGNAAMYGSAISSTQTCENRTAAAATGIRLLAGASVFGSSITAAGNGSSAAVGATNDSLANPAAAAVNVAAAGAAAFSRTLAALQILADSRCYVVAVSGTWLPAASYTSANSNGDATAAESTQQSADSSGSGGSDVPLMMGDTGAASLAVGGCDDARLMGPAGSLTGYGNLTASLLVLALNATSLSPLLPVLLNGRAPPSPAAMLTQLRGAEEALTRVIVARQNDTANSQQLQTAGGSGGSSMGGMGIGTTSNGSSTSTSSTSTDNEEEEEEQLLASEATLAAGLQACSARTRRSYASAAALAAGDRISGGLEAEDLIDGSSSNADGSSLSGDSSSSYLALPPKAMVMVSFAPESGSDLVDASGVNASAVMLSGGTGSAMPSTSTAAADTARTAAQQALSVAAGGAGPEHRRHVLRTGQVYGISIYLLNGLGKRVTVGSSQYRAAISVEPDPLPGALVPSGLVVSGIVNTTSMVAAGGLSSGSGAADAVLEATSVPELRMSILLLPCRVGERLDSSRVTAAAPHSTTCSPCPTQQLAFWQDDRPSLQDLAARVLANASVAADANASAASGGGVRSSGSAAVLPQDLGATMLQWMFDWTQGVVDVAICSNCPEGFWHSSPNSTLMHRCLQADACARTTNILPAVAAANAALRLSSSAAAAAANATAASSSGTAAAAGGATVVVRRYSTDDPRISLLLSCQALFYQSWPAGSYALAQYQAFVRQQQEQVAVASRVVPDNSTAATAAGSSSQAPPPAPSPSTSGGNTIASGAMAVASPASAAVAGTGAVAVVTDVEDFCLLWGVELFSSAGYMNAQCSEGYTGRLCAVCEQGYFLTAEVECQKCLSVERTAVLGIAQFLFSVALVLYTVWTNLREGAASYNRNTHRQNRQDRLEQEEQHQLLQSAQRQLKLASTTAAGGSGSGTAPHLTKAASRARSSSGAANGGTRQGPHGPQSGFGGGGGGMAPLATDGSAGGGWEEREGSHRYDEDDEDEISASEILKTAIVHIQIFVTITRLNISWPDLIVRFQGFLRSASGAENTVAYSPSCLYPEAHSGFQAQVQLVAALVQPFIVLLLVLFLWTARRMIWSQARLKRSSRSSKPHRNRKQSYAAAAAVMNRLRAAPAALPDDGGAVPFGTATVAVAVAEGVEEPEPEAASVAGAAAAVADGSGAVHTADASGDEPPATQERLTSGWRPRAAAAANGASAPQRPAGASQAMRPAPTLRPANLPALSIPCDPASAGPGPAVIHMGLATPPATATGTTARGTTRLTTKVYGAYGAFTSGGTGGNWKHSAAATSATAAAGPHGQQQQQQQQQHYQHPPGSTNTSTYPNGPATIGHQHQTPLPPPHPAPPPPPLQLLPSASSQRLVGTPNSIAMPTPQWRDAPRPRWARLFGFATSGGGGGGGQGGHMSHLMHLDQATSLRQQLFVVMTVGVFILYTGWAQAAFSVFACVTLDDGTGSYPDLQLSTWQRGYWLRNMAQECYSGEHATLWLPIGIVAVVLVCALPPLTSAVITYRNRHRLHEPRTQLVYGFLYSRYRPSFCMWESVVQLQMLSLVAVEVFGRALPIGQQTVLMLLAMNAVAAINICCAPLRHAVMGVLEFSSMAVLSATVMVGLFLSEGQDGGATGAATGTALGILIVIMNAGLLAALVALAGAEAEAVKAAAAGKVAHQRPHQRHGHPAAAPLPTVMSVGPPEGSALQSDDSLQPPLGAPMQQK
eukprot:XP_001698129.1 predicted protein [Chlamydomonas reinhardtii]